MLEDFANMAAKYGVPADRAAALYRAGVSINVIEQAKKKLNIELSDISDLYQQYGASCVVWLIELIGMSKN